MTATSQNHPGKYNKNNFYLVILEGASFFPEGRILYWRMFTGHEIVPNTGTTNATKFFTLATKSSKSVTKLVTEMLHQIKWIKKICKDKSMANFLVKFMSKTQHMHLNWWLDAIFGLGEPERCISSILVSSL